jgi:hypothetical protein
VGVKTQNSEVGNRDQPSMDGPLLGLNQGASQSTLRLVTLTLDLSQPSRPCEILIQGEMVLKLTVLHIRDPSWVDSIAQRLIPQVSETGNRG